MHKIWFISYVCICIHIIWICIHHIFVTIRNGWFTCRFRASSLMVFGSFRKSRLFPTSTIGTFGQKCFTSGTLKRKQNSFKRSKTDSFFTISPECFRVNRASRLKSTLKWRQCLDKRADGVDRSLLDRPYPKALALPGYRNWLRNVVRG